MISCYDTFYQTIASAYPSLLGPRHILVVLRGGCGTRELKRKST